MQCSSSSRNSATESEHDIEFGSQKSDESLEEQSGESPTFPRLFLQLFYFITVWHVTCRITSSAVCTLLKFLKFLSYDWHHLQLPATEDLIVIDIFYF